MRKALRGPEVSTHALSQQRLVSQQLLRRQHMSAPPVQSAVVEELRQLRDRVANDTTKLENVVRVTGCSMSAAGSSQRLGVAPVPLRRARGRLTRSAAWPRRGAHAVRSS